MSKKDDYSKHTNCGEDAHFSITEWNHLRRFHLESHHVSFDFVKTEMRRTPWREEFKPTDPLALGSAELILAKGPEYTKRRLREMILELVHLRTWVTYHREFMLNSSTLSKYDQKMGYEYTVRFDRLLECARYLRYRYSVMTPPSVPAPSAPSIESGSQDTSQPSTARASYSRPSRKRVIED